MVGDIMSADEVIGFGSANSLGCLQLGGDQLRARPHGFQARCYLADIDSRAVLMLRVTIELTKPQLLKQRKTSCIL